MSPRGTSGDHSQGAGDSSSGPFIGPFWVPKTFMIAVAECKMGMVTQKSLFQANGSQHMRMDFHTAHKSLSVSNSR